MYFLAGPLASIIRPIYNLLQNYGFTLIIVTVLIKIITIPLTIMSQKNVAKTQLIQPEMMRIQEKYKNDKNKQSIELQKLYQKNNVNPLGGCLPLILQMFVLFGFIGVIYNPLQHILQMSKSEISAVIDAVGKNAPTYQVSLCGIPEAVSKIKELGFTPINFDFFGIDLTLMPKGHEKDLFVWIFPAFAIITTILSSYITKKQTPAPAPNKEPDQAQSMGNSMLTIMPIMTAVFTYMMPIGMSLYWGVSTAFQIFQQLFLNKAINKKVREEIEGKKK